MARVVREENDTRVKPGDTEVGSVVWRIPDTFAEGLVLKLLGQKKRSEPIMKAYLDK